MPYSTGHIRFNITLAFELGELILARYLCIVYTPDSELPLALPVAESEGVVRAPEEAPREVPGEHQGAHSEEPVLH